MTEPGETVFLPALPARVHFVGIGGIGMSGLARILRQWGYEISGSDSAHSPLLDELASEGMAVGVGHTMTSEAEAADLVVATAAVRVENPELRAAHDAGRAVIKRAALWVRWPMRAAVSRWRAVTGNPRRVACWSGR